MNIIRIFALFLILIGINIGTVIAIESPVIYKLNQGDTVLISVWREDTLQRQLVVLPDGSVTFPLIGRVEVAGLSAAEVERQITLKLKVYFPDPLVSVSVVGIEGNRAYVTGKVMHPGPLIIRGPLTVIQAISLVGGLDRFANENGIIVVRELPAGQEIFPVNYKDIISGKNMSTNVRLNAGDTLVVP